MAVVTSSSASKQKLNSSDHQNSNGKKSKEDKSRKQSDNDCDLPAKRTKCPGVRLVGGRIYDSQNGKTCHQCRQKTMDFTASCKNLKMDKPCTIKFCHKCLLNRYGEKAEEMAGLEDWNCPKCRGICNCSFCMKKRGHRPTGILVHTAKATGFSSVSELLNVKGPENFGIDKIVKAVDVSPRKAAASSTETSVALPKKRGKENSFSVYNHSNLRPLPLAPSPNEKKQKKMKHEGLKEMRDGNQDNRVLLKESSPRKPQIDEEINPQVSNGVFKKELKTSRNFESVLEEKNNLNTRASKGNSSNLIGCESETQRDSKVHKDAELLDVQKLDKDGAQPTIVVDSCRVQTNAAKVQNKDIDADISLPLGTELTTVAGLDLPPEDVGHALQFFEFCAAFEEILDLKEGEPEYVLRELIRGGRGRRGKYSPIVQFHIQLLSMIQKDLGEDSPVITSKGGKNSWLHALQNYALRSQCVLEKLKLDGFGWEANDYDSLDSSKRLRLLTFLCDEVLCTAKMRSWIDDQNSKFVEKQKEAKERVLAAKHKEKQLRNKMQNEVAKAIIAKNGAPLSISEHEAIVSQIKTESAQAHAEMLQLKDMLLNDKQKSDAVRTESILLDIKGRTYWRLKGYSDYSNVLLQDVGTWDAVQSGEKWFTFDVEQEKEIEKHICSLRADRQTAMKIISGLLASTVSTQKGSAVLAFIVF
ncbi:unnamed protein product [Camellia sinensis]